MKVLQVLMQKPRGTVSGADIARDTKLLSGTVYPILLRLERAGWLSSEWETLDPIEAGRPRKRFYTLTGVGYNKAAMALRELGVQGVPAWQS
jgi:DNA-binding PadR family transcriptional regulator